jgi:hypothetical protein
VPTSFVIPSEAEGSAVWFRGETKPGGIQPSQTFAAPEGKTADLSASLGMTKEGGAAFRHGLEVDGEPGFLVDEDAGRDYAAAASRFCKRCNNATSS